MVALGAVGTARRNFGVFTASGLDHFSLLLKGFSQLET